MVWFHCEDCGDTIKKPKLVSHYRNCSSSRFSCVDCLQTFTRATVNGHTTCVTEHEKYALAATKPGGFAAGGLSVKREGGPAGAAAEPTGLEFLSTRPPWKCSVCNVNCTSRETLVNHAAGAKHKRRARAALAAANGGSNGLGANVNHGNATTGGGETKVDAGGGAPAPDGGLSYGKRRMAQSSSSSSSSDDSSSSDSDDNAGKHQPPAKRLAIGAGAKVAAAATAVKGKSKAVKARTSSTSSSSSSEDNTSSESSSSDSDSDAPAAPKPQSATNGTAQPPLPGASRQTTLSSSDEDSESDTDSDSETDAALPRALSGAKARTSAAGPPCGEPHEKKASEQGTQAALVAQSGPASQKARGSGKSAEISSDSSSSSSSSSDSDGDSEAEEAHAAVAKGMGPDQYKGATAKSKAMAPVLASATCGSKGAKRVAPETLSSSESESDDDDSSSSSDDDEADVKIEAREKKASTSGLDVALHDVGKFGKLVTAVKEAMEKKAEVGRAVLLRLVCSHLLEGGEAQVTEADLERVRQQLVAKRVCDLVIKTLLTKPKHVDVRKPKTGNEDRKAGKKKAK